MALKKPTFSPGGKWGVPHGAGWTARAGLSERSRHAQSLVRGGRIVGGGPRPFWTFLVPVVSVLFSLAISGDSALVPVNSLLTGGFLRKLMPVAGNFISAGQKLILSFSSLWVTIFSIGTPLKSSDFQYRLQSTVL